MNTGKRIGIAAQMVVFQREKAEFVILTPLNLEVSGQKKQENGTEP